MVDIDLKLRECVDTLNGVYGVLAPVAFEQAITVRTIAHELEAVLIARNGFAPQPVMRVEYDNEANESRKCIAGFHDECRGEYALHDCTCVCHMDGGAHD